MWQESVATCLKALSWHISDGTEECRGKPQRVYPVSRSSFGHGRANHLTGEVCCFCPEIYTYLTGLLRNSEWSIILQPPPHIRSSRMVDRWIFWTVWLLRATVPRGTQCSGSGPSSQLLTSLNTLYQVFSNCDTCTTSGTPATVQWYTDLVKINQRIKRNNFSYNKCSYIENLIKVFFFHLNI
jgi:hypothetical protein